MSSPVRVPDGIGSGVGIGVDIGIGIGIGIGMSIGISLGVGIGVVTTEWYHTVARYCSSTDRQEHMQVPLILLQTSRLLLATRRCGSLSLKLKADSRTPHFNRASSQLSSSSTYTTNTPSPRYTTNAPSPSCASKDGTDRRAIKHSRSCSSPCQVFRDADCERDFERAKTTMLRPTQRSVRYCKS